MILRDRDNTSCGGGVDPWRCASDGTLEERRYLCQNWRADVVAVTQSDGTPLEYVRYSSYGEPTVYPVADLDMDGDVDLADMTEREHPPCPGDHRHHHQECHQSPPPSCICDCHETTDCL
ncbi:MAG: hypothetical protein SFY69_05975 [Planctomycetota bacterium]|nr:hypothetical protein [Planctomycetota bacterium]